MQRAVVLVCLLVMACAGYLATQWASQPALSATSLERREAPAAVGTPRPTQVPDYEGTATTGDILRQVHTYTSWAHGFLTHKLPLTFRAYPLLVKAVALIPNDNMRNWKQDWPTYVRIRNLAAQTSRMCSVSRPPAGTMVLDRRLLPRGLAQWLQTAQAWLDICQGYAQTVTWAVEIANDGAVIGDPARFTKLAHQNLPLLADRLHRAQNVVRAARTMRIPPA